jgi:hypothetical protein
MAALCRVCDAPAHPSALLSPLPFLTCEACGLAFRDDRVEHDVHAIYESGAYTGVRRLEYSDPRTPV